MIEGPVPARAGLLLILSIFYEENYRTADDNGTAAIAVYRLRAWIPLQAVEVHSLQMG